MQRRTFIQVVGQACTAVCLAPDIVGADAGGNGLRSSRSFGQPSSTPDASDWETVSALLDNASSAFTEPWDDDTCRTLMSGGYLGNGDLGVHLGGTRHAMKYYLGKNGFHNHRSHQQHAIAEPRRRYQGFSQLGPNSRRGVQAIASGWRVPSRGEIPCRGA